MRAAIPASYTDLLCFPSSLKFILSAGEGDLLLAFYDCGLFAITYHILSLFLPIPLLASILSIPDPPPPVANR